MTPATSAALRQDKATRSANPAWPGTPGWGFAIDSHGVPSQGRPATNATIRPLLYRRRGEDKQALSVLTPDQFADLHNRKVARSNRTATRRAVQPTSTAPGEEPALFGLADGRATA